jgi:short subunit fatty acids transporter
MNIVLLAGFTIIMAVLHPKKNAVEADDATIQPYHASPGQGGQEAVAPAQRWTAPPGSCSSSVRGVYYVAKFIITKGIMNIDLNTLNFTFSSWVCCFTAPPCLRGVRDRRPPARCTASSSVPFYAGIFGMINYSGLAQVLATLVREHLHEGHLSLDRVRVLVHPELLRALRRVEVLDRGAVHPSGRAAAGGGYPHGDQRRTPTATF